MNCVEMHTNFRAINLIKYTFREVPLSSKNRSNENHRKTGRTNLISNLGFALHRLRDFDLLDAVRDSPSINTRRGCRVKK